MATATSKIPSSTAAQVTDKPLHFARIKFEPVESSSGLFEQVKTKDGVQFQCLACKFVSSKKQQVEDRSLCSSVESAQPEKRKILRMKYKQP